MSELDIVKEIAKKILIVPSVTNNHFDDSLWDRALRLNRNVDFICKLPEFSKSTKQVDMFCLKAATFLCNAGLAQQLTQQLKTRQNFSLSKVNSEQVLDTCLRIVEEKLHGVLDNSQIQIICRIISESSGNFARMTEAVILSEARNLDDMGAAGLFNELKFHAISGKSITGVLENWKRKNDYQYWQGRLKDSFKIESVRKLAAKRLAHAEFFMKQLHQEHAAQDLSDLPN